MLSSEGLIVLNTGIRAPHSPACLSCGHAHQIYPKPTPMIRKSVLKPGDYADFYAGYVDAVPDLSLRSALGESEAALLDYLTNVTEDREDYAYAPGKWTIKQCLQHITDTERIFTTRALRIVRGDTTPMPGFDQDAYAAVADVDRRSYRHMLEEFRLVRAATTILFTSLWEEDLMRAGTASGHRITAAAQGFIICGHTYHHATIFRERYQ
ncbi:DUF664 domain-containing protein [Lewinella sp. W8]|nr:DUF664 domain-containing protein [Lewinella sp. W8]